MSATTSQITGVSIVCSTVGSGADQRKHQSSASLTFVRGIQRWPVNSSHKRPVKTQKTFHLMTSWLEILVCADEIDAASTPQFDGLLQDCNISVANALEILQSWTEPSSWYVNKMNMICCHLFSGNLDFDVLKVLQKSDCVYFQFAYCPAK